MSRPCALNTLAIRKTSPGSASARPSTTVSWDGAGTATGAGGDHEVRAVRLAAPVGGQGALAQRLQQPEVPHHVRAIRRAHVALRHEREVALHLAGRELLLELPRRALARVGRAALAGGGIGLGEQGPGPRVEVPQERPLPFVPDAGAHAA